MPYGKWTIKCEGAQASIKLNGEDVPCLSATLWLAADAPPVLKLAVMPELLDAELESVLLELADGTN
jgi:hypothetical protein